MNKDLTVGKPESVLCKFCLPLFGSIIFQQLYNIADSFVAGKFIGDNALAAVGNSYEITLIFIAFAFGCNIGCSVLAAQLFGAKRYNDMKTSVYTSLITGAAICIVLMIAGIVFCDGLLRLIKTPEEVFADSKLYLDIYIYGLPCVFLYNVATGIFSALGDSKTPFIFLACSSLSNIGVDILFVTAFKMGVAGAARHGGFRLGQRALQPAQRLALGVGADMPHRTPMECAYLAAAVHQMASHVQVIDRIAQIRQLQRTGQRVVFQLEFHSCFNYASPSISFRYRS